MTVFNLEVEDAHSYFVAADVSAEPLWVHNSTYTNEAMRAAVNETDSNGDRWYRDPFTNRMTPSKQQMAADHILPCKEIEQLDGYRDLTDAQQRALKTDMKNIQPLPPRINSSKGARTAKDLGYILGEKVDPAYRDWLAGQEIELRTYFQDRINSMLNRS